MSKPNPFADPGAWTQIKIGGVTVPARITSMTTASAEPTTPAPNRWLGRCRGTIRVTFRMSREESARFWAVLAPAFRRVWIRRHLAARAMSRPRVRS